MTASSLEFVAQWVVPLGAAVIMFCIGLGVDPADLLRTLRRPRELVAGLALQLLMMPLLAVLMSRLLNLEPVLATGLVLAAACPISTPVNYLTRLGRGDVALAIALTALTSILAALTIP